MNGEQYLKAQLRQAIRDIGFAEIDSLPVVLEQPKSAEHGDLATNVAMVIASKLKKNPREIAADILQRLDLDKSLVSGVEIAGAGFLNFRFGMSYYQKALHAILSADKTYGESDIGGGKRVQLEFVSANPTGPLNVVSARAAAVGDVMGNLFAAAGFYVEKEYYVNDAGRQIKLLGQSVSARYMALSGKEEPFPEEGYHGDYVKSLAQDLIDEHGDEFVELPREQRCGQLGDLALESLLTSQQRVLERYGLSYDNWFRERALRDKKAHWQVIEKLTELGHVYEKDGAKWFRSTNFGDEKDRVLVTSSGEPTYFLVDVAYHADKYERQFDLLYDLWGPDHHGYIPRMKAALLALGYPKGTFDVQIIQQVNLLQNGKAVKMSKRAGKIIEMKELLDEVGVDVARYFFVARRNQSPLDFDLDLAKNTSEENPVYYVQYAHARICNIMRHAEEQGVTQVADADLSLLQEEEELNLIKKMLQFPDLVGKAATYLEPHRLPVFLQEFAAAFHKFYHHHRVVTDKLEQTRARLVLVKCTQLVLANGLKLLGLSAPERM